jgi:xylose isomerase
MDIGAELGAKIFVLWGGREGVETDGCRRADEAIKRLREAVNYFCEYNIERGYGMKLALEAKPNEPRADIYMATTGQYLGFIPTLDHPEMVGVNPEVAHEQMAGLNFINPGAVADSQHKAVTAERNDTQTGHDILSSFIRGASASLCGFTVDQGDGDVRNHGSRGICDRSDNGGLLTPCVERQAKEKRAKKPRDDASCDPSGR